jgi:HlyD family secretion protein
MANRYELTNAAPIRVVVSLERDLSTPTGYKWSSRRGPEIQIDSNTICSAKVSVKEQAPITLVIPVLKKFLLGTGADDPFLMQEKQKKKK